ncbi:MAG TPA: terminase large subunit [Gaiellaceae bacterium]|nr:terminase large subunit [Gaiellaceae bacterium]
MSGWRSYAAGSEGDHFAAFCLQHLVLSTDRWDGLSLELEPFQRRMMGEALAYGPDGLPVWSSVVIVMPRKNGKTQLLAAYAVYRLFTSGGSPEILLAASSDKQAGRLFKAAAAFIRRSPVLSELARVRDYLGEIVREDGRGVIYRVASDPNRLHGYDPSDVIVDELAQWTKPGLEGAYAALTSGGGARSSPRVFSITTAGEASTRHSSILGRLLDAATAGVSETEPGLTISRLPQARALVLNHEAPTADPYDVAAMKLANPASWIGEEYLARQAANPELTDAQVLQLHGCVWAATETSFVPPAALEQALLDAREIEDGARVVLAFDGSERRDETWIVAVSLDGTVQPLQRWARPAGSPDTWSIPRPEVHRAVEQAMNRFTVAEFVCDPPGWYREIDEWSEQYPVVVPFETRQPRLMAPAASRMRTALLGGEVKFAGPLARTLAAHFESAVAIYDREGELQGLRKDHADSPRKIDGAVAAIIGGERAAWHVANPAKRQLVASW